MNYYNEIKNKLIDNEVYSRVKDYSKERHKVITYFEIGKLLYEAGGKYDDNIIYEYSKKLIVEVGKKYNKRTLFRMKQFYNVFSDEKMTTMLTQLTWSHYLLLLSIKDYDEIIYYINTAKDNNLTQRQLQDKIQSNEYKRLPIEVKNKLIKHEKLHVSDLIPNPIKIKNKIKISKHSLNINGYLFYFLNKTNIDVLKVGHYGSKTSSSKEFIDYINPKYSLISVDENNIYGHPHKNVLDNLKNSKIYRTDKNGSVTFKIKNNKINIKTVK